MADHIVDSRLLQLYRKLRPEERRVLRKWHRSPVCQPNQEVSRLFDFLDSRKEITPTTVRKDRVFFAIFGDEAFDDARLRFLLHQANQSLEKFVGFFDAESEPLEGEIRSLWALYHRQQEAGLPVRVNKLRTRLQNQDIRGHDFHYQAFQLEQLEFNLSGTEQRTAANNLTNLLEHLSTYFVLNTLRYACVAATHGQVSRQEYEIPLLPAIVEAAKSGGWWEEPAVGLYLAAWQAVTQEDPEPLLKLIRSFPDKRKALPQQEQQDLLLLAINACIRHINTGGEEEFVHKALLLYQLGLDTGLLIDDGQISRFNYKNIVSIALKAGQFDWAETFIHQYADHLQAEFRESYLTFNLARLCFATGRYGDARRHLSQVEYDDVFFNLGARMMLVKMAYEEEDIAGLESQVQAFGKYLKRQTSLGYHREVYQNFLFLLNRMIHLQPFDREAIGSFAELMASTRPAAELAWLQAQFERRFPVAY